MKFHEYGKKHAKTLVIIHGDCMSWDMLMPSALRLKKRYHVILVAVPGMDLSTKEDFSSVGQIAKRIEAALIKRGLSMIEGLYGLSVGGSIALRILSDNCIRVKTAVIDAGVTPKESLSAEDHLSSIRNFLRLLLIKKGLKASYSEEDRERFHLNDLIKSETVIRHMSLKTIFRTSFLSQEGLLLPVFSEITTNIHYWYGEDEKEYRKTDIEYIKKHIPYVSFREIPEMDHRQYAITCPEEFYADFRALLGD